MSRFGKSYTTKAEIEHRFYQWILSEDLVRRSAKSGHNSNFKIAHNKYSDWSQEEFEKLLGYSHLMEIRSRDIKDSYTATKVPDSVDWRQRGLKVNPAVLDQGSCASDWAITAAAMVEAASEISASPQQVLDCTGMSSSCRGGSVSHALEHLKLHGVASRKDYPFVGQRGDCQFLQSNIKKLDRLAHQIYAGHGDVDVILWAVSKQPVAASMNASSPLFKLYSSGIFDDAQCSQVENNHAV